MNKFVKRVTSALCSAVVAVSTLLPILRSGNTSEVEAYSNAQKFVDTAMELDYISGRTNEATLHYNVSNCDWCAMFVHLSAYRCGLGDKIPKLAYCDNQYLTDSGYPMEGYKSYYEKKGLFIPRTSGQLPKIGDLIVFETSRIPDGKADHIGIVIGIDYAAGLIYTIEGNGGDDMVKYKSYPYYDSSIIGYCQTMLDSPSTGAIIPSTPATPSLPAGPSIPSVDMSSKQWEVTSPVGCNLRTSPNGEKLGIISTGTILTCDPSKNQGEWIFVKAAITETGAIFDGYIHCSTVMPESNKKPVTTTTVTTTSTTSTTTTTAATASTTASEAEQSTTTTVSTAPSATETTPQAPQIPTNTPSHYISSLIGANGRTSAEFDENNIARIIDTDTYLIINYYKNGFANCTIAETGETYFIHTSTISELPPSGDAYTECARTNCFVSSDCGVNLRAEGNYNGAVLCILDTYQDISVLTAPNELGFVYVEFTFGDGVIHNGYVHIDHISSY